MRRRLALTVVGAMLVLPFTAAPAQATHCYIFTRPFGYPCGVVTNFVCAVIVDPPEWCYEH